MDYLQEDNIELRSEEVQELMSQIPAWFLRWGITIVGIVLAGLLIGSYFFKYPDTLTAEITVTTAAPPVEIYAQTTGKLECINIRNNQHIDAGTVMAVVESTANYEDVEFVHGIIEAWQQKQYSEEELMSVFKKRRLSLGNLQGAFASFTNALCEYIRYEKENYFQRKIYLKSELQKERKALEQNWLQERDLHRQQAVIATKIFHRDSTLYGQKMISEEDFNNAEQIYLQSRQTAVNDLSSQTQLDIDKLNDSEIMLDLHQQHRQTKTQVLQSLYNTCEQLVNDLKQYEKDYLLKTPISGTINMMGNWEKNFLIEAGTLFVIVMPQEKSVSVGRARLPATGAGKVKVGQKVKVRLANFPDTEYGYIMGKVETVSSIPDQESNYYLEISFPQGLLTNYQKKLPQTKTMVGMAEIIVRDKRLIEHLIEPIEKMVNN